MPGQTSPAAAALLCSQPGGAGNARALGTAVNGRYDRWYATDMFQETTTNPVGHWYRNVRSARVFTPQTGASSLFLFTDTSGASFPAYPSFLTGQPYVQINNFAANELEVDLASQGFDCKPTSILLVHTVRGSEFEFSFKDAVLPQWNAFVASQTSDNFKADGGPLFGWDAFPPNTSSLSPNNIYLTIAQSFKFDPGWFWADYRIAMQVWILLSRNKDGSVSGSVQRTAWWSDDGALFDVIKTLMDLAMQVATTQINSALASALTGLKVKDLYFLPGGMVAPTFGGQDAQRIDDWGNDIVVRLELN